MRRAPERNSRPRALGAATIRAAAAATRAAPARLVVETAGAATIDRIGATIARSTNGSPLRALAEEVPARDRPGAQRDRTTGPRLKEPPQHIPGVDELSPPKSDSEGERRHGGDDQPHRIALDDGQGRTRHGAVRSVRWPTMSTNPRPSHARTTAARPSG